MVLPVITSCSADLPAIAEVQGMVGHSGYFGCRYCLIKGDPIRKNSISKAVIRFVAKDSSIRTNQNAINTFATLQSAMKSNRPLMASNLYPAWLSIAYTHCVLLGIEKTY